MHKTLSLVLLLGTALLVAAAPAPRETPISRGITVQLGPAVSTAQGLQNVDLAAARGLGLFRDAGPRRLAPVLERMTREAPDRSVKVWVFLTDKDVWSAEAYREALHAVEREWSPETRARRTVQGRDPGMAFTDLPVAPRHLRTLEARGFVVHRASRWLNAVSVTTPASRFDELASLPMVRYVQPVLRKRAPTPMPESVDAAPGSGMMEVAGSADSLEAAFYGPSYKQLDQIQALDLHRLGYTGAGVRVMMLDTGFKKDHPVFGTCTRLVAEYDFVQEDGNTQNEAGDLAGQHNHGTGVWATLGGYAPGELIGPAWAAEFFLAKTEDVATETQAEEDNYVAALEWADTLGVSVTSASLAYWTFDDNTGYTVADLDGDTAVITVAVDIAASKGILCVNSAGNSGPGATSLGTPADADTILTVGAVDSLGTVASFSSRGPTADGRFKPEIVARGVKTRWAQAWTDAYGDANGTSLSAPLIGGLAALIKEAHPDWDAAAIRTAIMMTGSQAGSPDNAYGWGLARGLDAIHYLGAVPSPPRMTLPFALCEPADSALVLTAFPTLVWGTSSAATPGDTTRYTVFLSDGVAVDTLDAGTDTTLTLAAPIAAGNSYTWWVHAVGDSGYVRKSLDVRGFEGGATVAVGPGEPNAGIVLHAAFPNPMTSGATLSWRAPRDSRVRLEVFSVDGRRLRVFEEIAAGEDQRVVWDGRNEHGVETAPGVYFYRLQVGGDTVTRKLVRLP